MLQKMKEQLIDNIQKAKKKGELTAHRVYEITQDSVVHTAQNIKAGAKDLRAVTKEAITVSIQSLIDAEEASKEKISAALHGAINGIKQVESQILDSTHKEITQSKKRLKKEEEKLAQSLNEAFEGAKESAGNFNEKIKADIEIALVDAKLKSTELLGITRDTVKAAVSNAITVGTGVEKTIVNITRDATSKALAEVRFSAKRARKVSETVLSAAVESAEELGSHISETASAAAEGIHLGLIDSVESMHQSLDKVGKGVVEFAADDLEQTKKDLNAIGDLFVETLRTVADRSGEVAKNILHELADDAKKAGSSLREKAVAASHIVAERLKELGSESLHKTEEVGGKAAHALSEETKKLAERMITVAKGAATGMWEGAKTAYNKDIKKENES